MKICECKREKFLSRVRVTGIGPGGCWIWTACVEASGYGRMGWNGRATQAHRVSWSMWRGEIPKGLVIDHLCRVRSCVNPDHLEPVTAGVNSIRGLAGIWRPRKYKVQAGEDHPAGLAALIKNRKAGCCIICAEPLTRRSALICGARECVSRKRGAYTRDYRLSLERSGRRPWLRPQSAC